jgi:cytochrome c6
MKVLFALLAVCSVLWQIAIQPVSADEINASKLFTAHCAACHAGGLNRVVAAKTLKKDALEKYDMYSVEKVAYQIKKGKNAMPAFGKKLSDQEIQAIAVYVIDQADHNWGKG